MKKFVLDTNILMYYLRGETNRTQVIDRLYAPLSPPNIAFISIATVAELYAIAIRHQWGASRWQILTAILNEIAVIPIDSMDLVQRYADIDVFSQGKLIGKPLSMSARNMGKNDLWIAATASLLNIPLLTSDADFNHLDGTFLRLHAITFEKDSK
jgi:tRNA(fMet)-specific endonuclease VapC